MRSLVADLLSDAARAFDEARADWFVFGAQAALLHGATRLTADVDITVRLAAGADSEGLAASLARHGFRLRLGDPAFVKRTSVRATQDVDDVRAILAANQGAFDAPYVRDTLRLLEAALGQSDLMPACEASLLKSRR